VVTRQRPRSTRLLVVVLVSASLAVITLDYRQGEGGPLAALGDTAKTAMAPLQRATTSVTRPIGNFFSGLAHLPSLETENQRQREEIAALKAEIAGGGLLLEQNEELLGLLRLTRALQPEPVTTATVIANNVSNFEWTVVIDRGSSDGVAQEQPVVTGSPDAPMLVGSVLSVSTASAVVRLIIDRDSATAAVLDQAEEQGLITGQGDSDLKMIDVETGTDVTAAEKVWTLGYEAAGQPGLYPSGLLVGEVSRLVPADNATEEYVEVRPAVDFDTLQFVLVLQAPGAQE
jgi:rod shape-determining protein MreC